VNLIAIISLTPALSHPTEEGESFAVSLENQGVGLAGQSFKNYKSPVCCSLAHRMGEGQGEGKTF
jgi:hypothetical protein